MEALTLALFVADLLLVAGAFYSLVFSRWRAAGGCGIVLLGSLPLLRLALGGEFRINALLILLASAGLAILVSFGRFGRIGP